jgi:hypothetical protein
MTIDRRSVLEVGLMGAAASSFSLAAVETAAAQSSTKTYVCVAWRMVLEGSRGGITSNGSPCQHPDPNWTWRA